MGRSEAPRLFVCDFLRAVFDWQVEVADEGWPLVAQCRVARRPHDLSSVAYSDDLFKIRVVRDVSLQGVDAAVDQTNSLEEALAVRGYAANRDKREIVPSVRRPAVGRACFEQNRFAQLMRPWARHLGGRYTWNGANGVEIRLRGLAAHRGWRSMGSCCSSDAPPSLMRMIFIVRVVIGQRAGVALGA